jgi:hypothetical protein
MLVGLGCVVAIAASGCGSASHTTARSTGASAATAACGHGQYAVRAALNGATGGAVTSVQVRYVRGPTCRLDTRLKLAITRPDGTLARPIAGNPAGLRIRPRLAPGTTLALAWVWRNWCQAGARFPITVQAGGAHATVAATKPRCDDRRAASTLRRLQGSG